MKELVFPLHTDDPVHFYGVNDANLDIIRGFFPNIRLVARGDMIKAIGSNMDLELFTEKFSKIKELFEKNSSLDPEQLLQLLGRDELVVETPEIPGTDIIVYGPSGHVVKARTANQKLMVRSSEKNDVVFAIGPSGTGKTYTAVALAVRALKNKEIKRIILTRPAVEAGENLGFLPGDLKEKIDPYLRPLYDALLDMIPAEKLKSYMEHSIIEVAPLAFMRGRTLDNAYVILDEAQNATEMQLKMFLTRMGPTAKFIVTGDVTQVDLPRMQPSGLSQAIKILSKIKGIDFVFLDSSDVVRHKLVRDIVNAYDKEMNDNDIKKPERRK